MRYIVASRICEKKMELTAQFEQYLITNKKVSVKTLRNYRADLKHFISWAQKHLEENGIKIISPHHLVIHLSPSLVGKYKGANLETGVPYATTNRRLSTLRNFSRFLQVQGLKTEDPTEIIENLTKDKDTKLDIEKVVLEFKNHLEKQNLSKSTLKNYISDTRQFFACMQEGGR